MANIARIGLFLVNSVGRVIPNKENATIKEVLNSSHQHRIIPDSDLPNTDGYPTIKTYLEREAADNRIIKNIGSLSLSAIVTDIPANVEVAVNPHLNVPQTDLIAQFDAAATYIDTDINGVTKWRAANDPTLTFGLTGVEQTIATSEQPAFNTNKVTGDGGDGLFGNATLISAVVNGITTAGTIVVVGSGQITDSRYAVIVRPPTGSSHTFLGLGGETTGNKIRFTEERDNGGTVHNLDIDEVTNVRVRAATSNRNDVLTGFLSPSTSSTTSNDNADFDFTGCSLILFNNNEGLNSGFSGDIYGVLIYGRELVQSDITVIANAYSDVIT